MELGVVPVSSPNPFPAEDIYTVILDGKVVGSVNVWKAENFVAMLRILKVKGLGEVTTF